MLSDIELFQAFNVDCGAALDNAIRKGENREPTQEEEERIAQLRGQDLWHFRPTQRTGKVVDFDALTPEELARKRDRERRARVERMAELMTPQKEEELAASDASVTSLLDPPEWV